MLEFVAGDRDQPGWCRVAGAFGQDGDDQEGVGPGLPARLPLPAPLTQPSNHPRLEYQENGSAVVLCTLCPKLLVPAYRAMPRSADALPWRLDADAYWSTAQSGGPYPRGAPVTATWDPGLTEAMLQLGVKVEEERALDDLLTDLTNPEQATEQPPDQISRDHGYPAPETIRD